MPVKEIHRDLILANELVYKVCGFTCSQIEAEIESAEYGAYNFKINGQSVKFRLAKITPTKAGQFVTLWKRINKGPIQPFDVTDDIDFYIIATRKGNLFGQFIFPKSVLHEKGILSDVSQGGKRAIRVYPPWDNTTSKQAQKTQQWQSNYFLDIPQENSLDIKKARLLFSQR